MRDLAASRGLRMTPQRAVLLRVISQTRNHPTADELFRKVRCELPTISHATVYRNLQELVRAGIIATLERAGGAVQYETNADDHHHFICGRCGDVTDVYLQGVAFRIDKTRSPVAPSRIDRAELQLHGVCATCARSS